MRSSISCGETRCEAAGSGCGPSSSHSRTCPARLSTSRPDVSRRRSMIGAPPRARAPLAVTQPDAPSICSTSRVNVESEALASTPAIELRGLTKRFGDTLALDHVDLVVRRGVVFGFLGRNGAGKTTTLRILSGLARPTAGSAHVLGHDVARAPLDVRADIGFLPDVPAIYSWMTAREYLELAGRLCGLEQTIVAERANALLEMAGLEYVQTRTRGMCYVL